MSKEVFREALLRNLEFDLPELQAIYRHQQLRIFTVIGIGVLSIGLGLFSFFPTTIILLFFILYFLYYVIYSRGKQRKRIQKDVDVRRMMLRAVMKSADLSFTLQTHRYMPVYAFRESGLFNFKADSYKAEELVEVQGKGRWDFSRVEAAEKVDAFERSGRDPKSFRGFVFRIYPSAQQSSGTLRLPPSYLLSEQPGQRWLAIPHRENLFRLGPLHIYPSIDACYALYEALGYAEQLEQGMSLSE